MRYLLALFTVFTSLQIYSQKPIEKNIGDFKELKVYDLIEVELIKSDENKVIITGENIDYVIVNNKNGTLKIKMELSKIFDGNDTKVKLYYTKVDIIDANEGVKIHSKDEIKQFEIDLKAQEGKNIYCDGGAQIVQLLLQKNLIDEYIISIIPILLGDGKRLFLGDSPLTKLKLIESKQYESGLVQVRYGI